MEDVGFWTILAPGLGILEPLWGLLWASWDLVEALGASWEVLQTENWDFRIVVPLLDPSWSGLGANLGRLGRPLGRLGAHLGWLRGLLGTSWAVLGKFSGPLGPSSKP